jgi:hypothetical protein
MTITSFFVICLLCYAQDARSVASTQIAPRRSFASESAIPAHRGTLVDPGPHPGGSSRLVCNDPSAAVEEEEDSADDETLKAHFVSAKPSRAVPIHVQIRILDRNVNATGTSPRSPLLRC